MHCYYYRKTLAKHTNFEIFMLINIDLNLYLTFIQMGSAQKLSKSKSNRSKIDWCVPRKILGKTEGAINHRSIFSSAAGRPDSERGDSFFAIRRSAAAPLSLTKTSIQGGAAFFAVLHYKFNLVCHKTRKPWWWWWWWWWRESTRCDDALDFLRRTYGKPVLSLSLSAPLAARIHAQGYFRARRQRSRFCQRD
jgi:hypothetical protein